MSDYLPVKHVRDPVTGEILGTVPEGDTIGEQLLIEDHGYEARMHRARDIPVGPPDEPRQRALTMQARAALNVPFPLAMGAADQALGIMEAQVQRVLAVGAKVGHPPVDAISPGYCDVCGAAIDRCACRRTRIA